MKRSNKKGFTTVELVIVIAVIAILAAVLIPTFANLIEKANLSADQQAVRNMNVILKQDEAVNGKPENVDAAVEVLVANDFADFNTYSSNSVLGWIAEENVVVLVEKSEDEDATIVYPEDYTEGEYTYEVINPAAETMEDVLNALQAGTGTVFLGSDVTAEKAEDLYFTGSNQASLNLGGKTVSTNVPNTTKGYKDGIVVDSTSEATISDGIIEGGEEIEQVVSVYDEAEVTIDNTVISGGSKIAVLAEAGGTANISNSTILGVGTNPVQCYGGTMVLDNVTVVQSGNNEVPYYDCAIQAVNEIAYVDGAWKITGNEAHLTVNSGSYSGATALQVSDPGAYVTINGGTFTGTTNVMNIGMAQSYYDQGYRCEVTINGGTFNGTIKVAPLAKLVINGGTFSVDPSAWVGAGHTATQNSDGTWTVK